MYNTGRNLAATRLPIKLTKAYFVIGGIVYVHSTFTPTSLKFLHWTQQADLVVLDTGRIIKNRGIVNVVNLATEIQKVVLDGLDAYDANNPALYFVELNEEQFNNYDFDQFKTVRQISVSTTTLYN